jgi:proline iminopeptidase
MKIAKSLGVILGLAMVAIGAGTADEVSPLYPMVEPSRSGYFRVSDVHELYWEVVGNPDGTPVIVLHGGPGGSAGPDMRRFFDPERFHVLLFDQRGAGRSKPRGEWRDNNTQLLVEDVNLLRAHAGFDGKAILFGGSWGTTLALAYAESHPDRVSGIVLRGVFLATRDEIDHFYHGGASRFFPENWNRLREIVPEPQNLNYPAQLFEMITGDDAVLRDRAIEGWAYYEIRMSSVGMTDEATWEIIERYRDAMMPFALLENYYMMHGCFLEEGQLLRDAHRIAEIPTFIVNGRLDPICPPRTAYELAQRLKRVELELPESSGHSQNEPESLAALVRGVEWVADQIQAGSGGASGAGGPDPAPYCPGDGRTASSGI